MNNPKKSLFSSTYPLHKAAEAGNAKIVGGLLEPRSQPRTEELCWKDSTGGGDEEEEGRLSQRGARFAFVCHRSHMSG